jgi:hypothetical protein
MRRVRGVVGALVAGLALQGSPLAFEIKDTVKITISGKPLPVSIEIVDPSVLALSHVFEGAFIGAPVSEPDASWPRYTLTFDIQTRDGVKSAAYVVAYTRSRWTGEAFVYLPGPDDGPYRRNISTILREGANGRWHRASEKWSAAINARLP